MTALEMSELVGEGLDGVRFGEVGADGTVLVAGRSCQVEAESVAYGVTAASGLDAARYTFAYVAS